MAHECPRTEILLVKFDRPLEINYSLVMIPTQAVVVSNSAARLRSVFVVVEHIVS